MSRRKKGSILSLSFDAQSDRGFSQAQQPNLLITLVLWQNYISTNETVKVVIMALQVDKKAKA